MIDPILALAHSVQSNRGVFAVLLGSGVSRSAGIPTGWEVTLDLVKRVAAMEGVEPTPDPEAWFAAKHGKGPEYSALLDALAKTAAERRAILHSLFEPKPEERDDGLKLPTKAHRAIARLVAKGYVNVVVTTNFDRLMELALQDEGVVPTVISTADGTKGAAPLVPAMRRREGPRRLPRRPHQEHRGRAVGVRTGTRPDLRRVRPDHQRMVGGMGSRPPGRDRALPIQALHDVLDVAWQALCEGREAHDPPRGTASGGRVG